MELLGREKELNAMEAEFAKAESFMLAYGRRGVGKTSLIIEFIKNKRALFFTANRETERLHLCRYKQRLNLFAEHEVNIDELGWEAMLIAAAELYPDEKKVLVLDDVQYLLKLDPNFMERMLTYWESFLKRSNVMLLLCGNFTSVKPTDEIAKTCGNVLYMPSFVTALKVRQMRFTEVHECFPEFSFTELMERYFVASGMPVYFKYFYNKTPLIENIAKYVLDRDAPLFREPISILEREVREPVYYFSILKVISENRQKLPEIYGALDEKANTLSPYISSLMDMDHIAKRVPPTEPFPEKSRRGHYYIFSGFMSFWFYFVYPFFDDLELGQKERAIANINSNLFAGDYMRLMSYRIARNIFLWLCETKQVDFVAGKYSKTGASRIQEKVLLPLVSFEEGTDRAFSAFCEYNFYDPLGLPLFNKLVELSSMAEDVKGKELVYGLFSKTGFDNALVKQAEEMGNVLLVDEFQVVVAPK